MRSAARWPTSTPALRWAKPRYLGSSFAFIGVVIAATGYAGKGPNANIAVALGNAWRETGDPALMLALQAARPGAENLVAEHIDWALLQREP